jgi:kynurenine formamidase
MGGEGFRSNMVEITAHAGTHIDSITSFFCDKPSIEQILADTFIGDAIVLDLTAKGHANARIGHGDLDAAARVTQV